MDAANLHWARPPGRGGSRTGALVLAGSSGRLDVGRAEFLAGAGVTALALRWFGGPGQPPVPCEVPLETFTDAVDLMARECERVVVIGLSYGAEAALLTAVREPRVTGVVALAPTDVAWEGQHLRDDDPPRSKWTWQGRPVPFVPLDREWQPGPSPSFAELYACSRNRADPVTLAAATIPVERIEEPVLLAVGGDDRVWPSSVAARAIADRRARYGRATTVVRAPRAGHPVVLPGEAVPDLARSYQVGGDDGAPQRLGAQAWPLIRDVLGLG